MGTRILTLDGTDLDATGNGDHVGPGVKAIVAAEEARAISQRVRRACVPARRGEGARGPRPYGYQRRDLVSVDEVEHRSGPLVIVDEEAAIVREAARRVLSGETVTGVAEGPALSGGAIR